MLNLLEGGGGGGGDGVVVALAGRGVKCYLTPSSVQVTGEKQPEGKTAGGGADI